VKIKLDENLGRSVAAVLADAGHDVATVVGQGMAGAPDRSLLATCRREGRCIVTCDAEFGNPLMFRPSDSAGMVVLRLPARPGPNSLVELAHTLVQGLDRGNVTGKLWVVQHGRIREYQPPDRS